MHSQSDVMLASPGILSHSRQQHNDARAISDRGGSWEDLICSQDCQHPGRQTRMG